MLASRVNATAPAALRGGRLPQQHERVGHPLSQQPAGDAGQRVLQELDEGAQEPRGQGELLDARDARLQRRAGDAGHELLQA